MRVASFSVGMNAYHESLQVSARRESLELRTGQRTDGSRGPALPAPETDRLSLTSEAEAAGDAAKADGPEETRLSPNDRLAADIIRRLLKALTGRDVAMPSPEELYETLDGAKELSAEIKDLPPQAGRIPRQETAGFGLIYDYAASQYEQESMSFSAEGVIRTKDGQEFRFSAQINMTREFYMEHRESLRLGEAAKIDPLVLNFDGTGAELEETRFEFDLDADGSSEQIARLGAGSGFLALDRNEDGAVNNGRELFGPTTGNGFAELSAYDDDRNGFIDEDDAIYDKLRIWLRDGSGAQKLVGLGQMGVGAIYLGHLSSPFRSTDSLNNPLGEVTSTGLFFREDGSPGTVQQIDYIV